MTSWPNKPVPEFTNEELATALERNEGNPDANQDIVRSCISEWERRHDIPTAGA